MACCIIAAFLMAQCVYLLRRWGRFWCILPKDDAFDEPNIVDTLKVWLQKPFVKVAAVFLVTGEVLALGLWISESHGEHIASLYERAYKDAALEQVVYSTDGGAFLSTTICTSDGQTKQMFTSLN